MSKRHNMAIDFAWGEDDNMMGGPMPMEMFGRPRSGSDFRNKRYIEAYGNYSGGYGPPSRPPPRPLRPPMMGPGPLRGFAPRPPFPMLRGMGPRGPPPKRIHDDQAVKYLLRCGVPKESVKNLPSDLLQLIEPQYCGLCGFDFDSFPSSRIHYVSKNHLKAQKRWLSQKSEMGHQREVKRRFKDVMFPQAPLKARELYCELCDVHITSKVHADSHYSGKNHRAIVEGRKNPKNPVLLQKNMQARLEQLIRREKKHIKVVKESETSAEPKPTPVKSFQNELYCDICKTSMTCSEQMTMHLNGKRHLTKEKQHILKMMKGGGEVSETVTEQPDEKNETVEEGGDVQPGEGNETVEDGGNQQPLEEEEKQNNEVQSIADWGEGTDSGTWDEN